MPMGRVVSSLSKIAFTSQTPLKLAKLVDKSFGHRFGDISVFEGFRSGDSGTHKTPQALNPNSEKISTKPSTAETPSMNLNP